MGKLGLENWTPERRRQYFRRKRKERREFRAKNKIHTGFNLRDRANAYALEYVCSLPPAQGSEQELTAQQEEFPTVTEDTVELPESEEEEEEVSSKSKKLKNKSKKPKKPLTPEEMKARKERLAREGGTTQSPVFLLKGNPRVEMHVAKAIEHDSLVVCGPMDMFHLWEERVRGVRYVSMRDLMLRLWQHGAIFGYTSQHLQQFVSALTGTATPFTQALQEGNLADMLNIPNAERFISRQLRGPSDGNWEGKKRVIAKELVDCFQKGAMPEAEAIRWAERFVAALRLPKGKLRLERELKEQLFDVDFEAIESQKPTEAKCSMIVLPHPELHWPDFDIDRSNLTTLFVRRAEVLRHMFHLETLEETVELMGIGSQGGALSNTFNFMFMKLRQGHAGLAEVEEIMCQLYPAWMQQMPRLHARLLSLASFMRSMELPAFSRPHDHRTLLSGRFESTASRIFTREQEIAEALKNSLKGFERATVLLAKVAEQREGFDAIAEDVWFSQERVKVLEALARGVLGVEVGQPSLDAVRRHAKYEDFLIFLPPFRAVMNRVVTSELFKMCWKQYRKEELAKAEGKKKSKNAGQENGEEDFDADHFENGDDGADSAVEQAKGVSFKKCFPEISATFPLIPYFYGEGKRRAFEKRFQATDEFALLMGELAVLVHRIENAPALNDPEEVARLTPDFFRDRLERVVKISAKFNTGTFLKLLHQALAPWVRFKKVVTEVASRNRKQGVFHKVQYQPVFNTLPSASEVPAALERVSKGLLSAGFNWERLQPAQWIDLLAFHKVAIPMLLAVRDVHVDVRDFQWIGNSTIEKFRKGYGRDEFSGPDLASLVGVVVKELLSLANLISEKDFSLRFSVQTENGGQSAILYRATTPKTLSEAWQPKDQNRRETLNLLPKRLVAWIRGKLELGEELDDFDRKVLRQHVHDFKCSVDLPMEGAPESALVKPEEMLLIEKSKGSDPANRLRVSSDVPLEGVVLTVEKPRKGRETRVQFFNELISPSADRNCELSMLGAGLRAQDEAEVRWDMKTRQMTVERKGVWQIFCSQPFKRHPVRSVPIGVGDMFLGADLGNHMAYAIIRMGKERMELCGDGFISLGSLSKLLRRQKQGRFRQVGGVFERIPWDKVAETKKVIIGSAHNQFIDLLMRHGAVGVYENLKHTENGQDVSEGLVKSLYEMLTSYDLPPHIDADRGRMQLVWGFIAGKARPLAMQVWPAGTSQCCIKCGEWWWLLLPQKPKKKTSRQEKKQGGKKSEKPFKPVVVDQSGEGGSLLLVDIGGGKRVYAWNETHEHKVGDALKVSELRRMVKAFMRPKQELRMIVLQTLGTYVQKTHGVELSVPEWARGGKRPVFICPMVECEFVFHPDILASINVTAQAIVLQRWPQLRTRKERFSKAKEILPRNLHRS